MNARTLSYSILSCLLLLSVTACNKCSSNKGETPSSPTAATTPSTPATGAGKAEYIAKLDAQCKSAYDRSMEIAKKWAAEEMAKKSDLNPTATQTDFSARMLEKGMNFDDEETQKMKAVAEPSEDAATLTQIWSQKAKLNEDVRGMITTLKKFVAVLSKLNDEEIAKPASPETNEITTELGRQQKDIQEKAKALKEIAAKYGFKECFMGTKSEPRK